MNTYNAMCWVVKYIILFCKPKQHRHFFNNRKLVFNFCRLSAAPIRYKMSMFTSSRVRPISPPSESSNVVLHADFTHRRPFFFNMGSMAGSLYLHLHFQ